MTQRSTFIIEAINSINGGALMIPSQQEEVLRVLDLERQQQADRLDRVLPAVHVVAQEQVVRVRRKSAQLE